jgi:hypothetical protein
VRDQVRVVERVRAEPAPASRAVRSAANLVLDAVAEVVVGM